MGNWFFSLQFRLLVGFILVLALALGSVGVYVAYASQQEADRLQEQGEEARRARIKKLVAQHYSARERWGNLQPALEQAGALYGWRIAVRDNQGELIADTHRILEAPRRITSPRNKPFPVLSNGRQVGSIIMDPATQPNLSPEPSFTRLVSELNQSLLWTGLAVGAGGVVLILLMSRRALAPLNVLAVASRRLGQGDLSQRVPVSGQDEIAQLSGTFNSMAGNLERAEKQRRGLMADVAHELRTPLSNIQGYLEAIKDGLVPPNTTTIDTIHEEVVHLSRLVEDLRLLAQADAGALHLNREPDSLEDLLRRTVEAFRPRTEAKEVSISLDMPPGLPLVNMDRTRIAQVLSNLLENALTHTPQDGSIRVSAQLVDDLAEVTVADSGEGLPADVLPHVFDRFYRSDPSRSRSTGGAGLGLAIAKQLVESNGGSIRAESTVGQGSRFVFQLELSKDQS